MMQEHIQDGRLQGEAANTPSNDINLLDLLVVLARHKRLVIGTPIVTGTLAIIASLLMTPIYTSTAKIMPPQQQQGSGLAAAMLGQLGGLAGAASGIAGLKNPNDLYVGMLESRTIADNLIARFKLKERFDVPTMDDARLSLDKVSDIASGKKDGLISISVSDKDPKFAAELANAYVDELMKLNKTMAISEASLRRLFFEKQLKEAKEQLADAEVAMRKTQERTGMIQPDGQVQAIISTIAELKGAVTAKEVQIKAMRTFATAQNPDLIRAEEELRGLQAQLAKLEKSQSVKDGDFMVPTGKLPEVGVEYVRRLRDVKYFETLFEMLAKQYELAKIDEAKDSSVIQVLDRAVPAERRTKPKRTIMVLAGGMIGAVFGILISFVYEWYLRSRHHPKTAKRWEEFLSALKMKTR